ncbi:hypothetical protein KGM_202632 [Danaus plexippus plexippus]|uniref:Uncharacterized protein n=2 Tax=Danaus plexippus TaxID=13037 RepID=A0A212EJX5_DANPL|nr:hypothetical protein KGM_202632 [Danaus plexippus plexippus]
MDTSRIFCVEWARKMLEQVHPDLRIRRVVLLNTSGLPINTMAVNASEIISFTSENKLDLISGNISKPEDAKFLATRILKYIEVSIGIKTGIPNLNI